MDLIWAGRNPSDISDVFIGGKERGLLELYLEQKSGLFKVPEFFVIPSTFFDDYVAKHNLEHFLEIKTVKQLNELSFSDGTSYRPTIAPNSIKESFQSFFDDYKKVLIPAIEILKNSKEHFKVGKINFEKMNKRAKELQK